MSELIKVGLRGEKGDKVKETTKGRNWSLVWSLIYYAEFMIVNKGEFRRPGELV